MTNLLKEYFSRKAALSCTGAGSLVENGMHLVPCNRTRNPKSGNQHNFCFGIRNPVAWNPESRKIKLLESGIEMAGIGNPGATTASRQ